jgi:hypothetical protein
VLRVIFSFGASGTFETYVFCLYPFDACVAAAYIEQKFQKCHLHRLYYNICVFARNRRYSVEQKPYCQYSVVSAEG